MVMTPTEFYEDLTADIAARRSALSDDEGATFFNRPMTDEELVEWLSFQAYYELAACRFIGSWLADTPERDVMVMLAQQVEDEGLHYEYCMRLLEKRGITSLDHWTPEPEWVAWIDEWYPSGNDTIERVAAHNFTGELGACDAFLTVKDRVPEDVLKTLERIIPDEQFHVKIGRHVIENYCVTEEQQARVRARVERTFELEQAGRVAYNRRMAQLGIGQ